VKTSFFCLTALLVSACANPATHDDAASGAADLTASASASASATVPVTQYFRGQVVFSTLDGSTTFGPPTLSLVRRVADPAHDRVIEAVTEHGQTFVTIMKRKDGLVFSADDTAGTFHGTLTYADDALTSWSYDIEVKPAPSCAADGSPATAAPTHLTGSLPDNGGRITANGLTIRKIFDGQTLASESFQPITEAEYNDALASLVP
jgi:hypothetical protein